MKKWAFILSGTMLLGACSGETTTTESDTEEIETVEVSTEKTESSEPSITESEPQSVKENETELTPLTLEDFNNRYELDKEYSEPYVNGKFELKDGSIINGDWYFYLEGDTFYYASAKFLDGQLVQARLDLKENVTKEEVLNELGLSDEVKYEESNLSSNVVDIVVDDRFDDANISRLPNEWD